MDDTSATTPEFFGLRGVPRGGLAGTTVSLHIVVLVKYHSFTYQTHTPILAASHNRNMLVSSNISTSHNLTTITINQTSHNRVDACSDSMLDFT
jgi:hypothetical protein